MNKEAIFPDGIRIYTPSPNAPTYIKGNVEIDVSQLVPFLNGNHKNGKVRLQLKESQKGTLYLQLDTYVSPKDKDIDAIKENINDMLHGEDAEKVRNAREDYNTNLHKNDVSDFDDMEDLASQIPF
jgi:hypothetical protein